MKRKLAAWSVSVALLALLPAASAQTLTHRYSFFNKANGSTNVVDSVGTANGSLAGTAAITGGQLVLSGASGCYANLPTELITGYSAVTVEAWANYGTLVANCYLFSFGDTDSSGDGEDYNFCAPDAARITISGVDPGWEGEQNATCSEWTGLTDLHVVAVFNPPLGYLALYTNGVLAGTNNAETIALSSVKDVYNYIGRSLYTADPYAPIKVDEFRIWNGALNGLQAAADYLAGETVTNANPGTVTNLQLQVASSMLQGAQQNAAVTAQTTEITRAVDITKFCSYSSGNTNIFTVSGTGLITAVGPGTANIVALYASVSATQSVTVTVPPAVMTHRYSFLSEPNGSTTATDTVASANGTLEGSAVITNGQLVLSGVTGTYVTLPTGIITSAYPGATIEAWASFGTLPANCYLFAFGNTDSSGDGEDYIFCAPQTGRATITGTDPGETGEQNAASGVNWSGQTNMHVVAVFEPPAGYIALYTNGFLAASNNAVTTPLSSVDDVYSYIGRSLYTADPYAPLSVSEFRIYNGPLSPQQIALDAASGPSQIVTNSGALLSMQLKLTPMLAGATEQAVVLGNFANVSNVNLFTYGPPTVVSTNSSVISISSSGLVSAIGPGSATVVATYGGLSVTNTLTVTGFATNAFVFDSFSDGFWTIVNQGNGNVFVANSYSGTQQTYTNGATAQQFEVLYNLQNSTFRLRQRSSWNCVGSLSAIPAPGTAIESAFSYTGASYQQWHVVNAGGGYYRIFNAASNLVIQTDNGSPANVTLATPSASAFQLWQFNYQTHYPKKGTSDYEGDSSRFETSWAYNYDDNTSASEAASFDFVPMVYSAEYWETVGAAESLDSGWLASPKPAYLLCYNEPDNSTKSDTSTNTAISVWPSLEALNVPLVGPATQDTEDAWENDFYDLIAANNYRVDYAAVHEYVPPNAASLISDLYSVYTAYGRPVWLTEFSPVDWSDCECWSENDDYNFLAEFMWQAEAQDWLKRYAIFIFSGTNSASPWVDNGYRGNFFLADGATLSPYGELYATWDATLTLQAVTPYIIHNLATSFRLTDSNSISTPQASDIYVRNATTEWALLQSPTPNYWYIISLNDGRRLSCTNGALALSPFGTVGTVVQWTFTGPGSSGYYFIANPAAALNLYASGTAPAISFSTISSSTETANTRWRLVKPYQPVSIPAAAAPGGLSTAAGDGTVTLGWTPSAASDLYYNVYRSTVSGGPYMQVASLLRAATFTDSAVTDGVSYYYVVTGLNILGQESSYSAEISAQPTSQNPPLLSFGMATNGIQFSWPSTNTGWQLQAQTNSLGTNWVTLPGSSATNLILIPINPTNGAVFYRLVYP